MKKAVTLIIPLVVLTPGLMLSGEMLFKPTTPKMKETTPLVVENKTEPLAPQLSQKSIPAESLYQLLAAEMAIDREYPEIALVNYIAAARQTQDPAIAERATEIALTAGSLEEALTSSTLWAKFAPDNLDAQITTAALYIRQDQTAKAIPYMEKAIQRNPEEAYEYFILLYEQLPDEKDNARFVEALKTLSNNFQYDSAPLALAKIYLSQNKDNLAYKMSQTALKINPQSINAITLHAQALLKTKDKFKAKEFLEEKLKKDESNLELRYYLAQFLQQQNFTAEGHKEAEIVLKEANFSPKQLIDYGRFAIEANWFDLAEKAFLKAKEDDDTKDVAYYFLARLAQIENNDKKAIAWFKQVLTGPFHVISQIRASLLLSEEKKYNEALTLLDRTAASNEAEKKQLVLSKVDILNQAKSPNKAMELLNEALSENPDEVDFLYARSLIAESLNKIDIAEKDLKHILQGEPDNINALNTLGFILTNKTTRYQEAQHYLKRAYALSPNNPAVLDSLGWLYYKTGDYANAVEMLQKAVTLKPDAQVAAHLGEVLWNMKEFAKAKSVWQNALAQFPQHSALQEVMARYLSQEAGKTKEDKK